MYLIQNACKNVLRNKGRNILLGAIILVVITSVVTALIINATATGIIEDYKTRFGSEVTLQPDVQKLREQAQSASTDGRVRIQVPTIPPAQYVAFGESDYLQSADYRASTNANSSDLAAIDADKGGGGGIVVGGSSSGGEITEETLGTQYYFKLLGNQFGDFGEGLRELEEGRMPEAANECIISTDLAENSGIAVGDAITLTSELEPEDASPDDADTADKVATSYTLTVVGTYLDATEEYGNSMMESAYTNRRNEILTTFETVVAPLIEGMRGIDVSATYYLKAPTMLEAFAGELYAKGLDPLFTVSTDTTSYSRVVSPVEGLKGITFVFVIVVLVIGGAVIALLSSIAVRERKYEIGVLRAMGMKKRMVGLGLWMELVVVTAVCLVLGLGIGAIAAQPASDLMLEAQNAASEDADSSLPADGGAVMISSAGSTQGYAALPGTSLSSAGGLGFSQAEPLTSIDVSLDWLVLLQVAAAALALASIAGLLATLQITKYEPIKILMERN